MTGPHLAATVTVLLSFLAGITFGTLLCFRHWRTGMLGLAATCAGMAVIVVVTETAGGSTTGQALKMAAVFAFFSPMIGAFGALLCFRHWRIGMLGLAATCAGMAVIEVVTRPAGGSTIGQVLVFAFFSSMLGAVLASVIIVITRWLWRITRRTVKAIGTFGGDVLTDVRGIAKRPTDQERGPRRLSKASRLSVTFLVFTGIMLVGLNIGAISAMLTRVAPRLSVVTNCLDVISLILMTPKLFTIESEADVLDLKIIQPMRSFTLNKIVIPRNILVPFYRATLIIFLIFISKYLVDYNASQLLAVCASFNKILANNPALLLVSPVCDYFTKHVIEIQMVSAKMWSSFFRPLMFVSGVVVISLTLLRLLRAIAKSPEAQENLDNMALFFGLVVFTYSRTLSMME
jgi:hypothetical protein